MYVFVFVSVVVVFGCFSVPVAAETRVLYTENHYYIRIISLSENPVSSRS